MTAEARTLDAFMALDYPIRLVAEREGGYTVVFPDLPGCMTQVETIEDFPRMAREARELWTEGVLAAGQEVPLPSYPAAYSGKFVLRLPRTLHRSLAEAAEREGVSLNQHIVALLARAGAEDRLEWLLARVIGHLEILARTPGAAPLQDLEFYSRASTPEGAPGGAGPAPVTRGLRRPPR